MDEAVDGLSEIGRWTSDFSNTTANVAGYVTAAILMIALIFVVWAIASNKNNAKSYLIAWFVALIFALIFVLQ